MLHLKQLSKDFAGNPLFTDISWHLKKSERVALVGENGAGKSTLMKIIAGLSEPSAGEIQFARGARAAYLPQDGIVTSGALLFHEARSAFGELLAMEEELHQLGIDLEKTGHTPADHEQQLQRYGDLQEQFRHRGGYTMEAEIGTVLKGLGFSQSDWYRDCGEFSGGWQMRIALARLLLQRPDVLLLDEPTNHLDIEARNWLEDYLCAYQGGIILVSHDRYFLDRVTTRTVEVSRGRLTEYVGGYSRYLVAREERFALEMAAFERQRLEIEHMESFISRFRYQASKARLVQSRIKQLDKLERLEPPEGAQKPPAISFPKCERSTRRVFELKGAVKRYGALTVYDGVDLTIERGARIALVGPNGSGKSTMMKLLAGVEAMTGGERIVGASVQAGYFAQNLAESLSYEKTVLEELSDSAQGRTMAEIRSMLGAMLFSGDDVYKRVEVLSGGERARLALAKVLARPSNCLLLDEPTNNLDIIAKDTLLDALRRFPGTVIIVSHDRFILNELVTEVLEVGQGHAIRYLGNYDEYLEKKAQTDAAPSPSSQPTRSGPVQLRDTRGNNGNASRPKKAQPPKAAQPVKPGHPANDDRDALRKRERIARQRTQIEAGIEQRETERAALSAEMNDPNFYLARKDADDLIARYERLGREIEKLYADLVKFDEAASA